VLGTPGQGEPPYWKRIPLLGADPHDHTARTRQEGTGALKFPSVRLANVHLAGKSQRLSSDHQNRGVK
jgi:hypothetical protein